MMTVLPCRPARLEHCVGEIQSSVESVVVPRKGSPQEPHGCMARATLLKDGVCEVDCAIERVTAALDVAS